jgi:hypothetical protein
MNMQKVRGLGLAAISLLVFVSDASAHEIRVEANNSVSAPFDIIETRISTANGIATFKTQVRGKAGSTRPATTGKFEGSHVYAYVWPTSLNSADVGFEKDQGIVALAATFHPDFDDASKRAPSAINRDRWHAHWVVLNKDNVCPGGLKVRDIPVGTTPKLPPDWPGVPILIDSPSYHTKLANNIVEVHVPLNQIGALATSRFDGVTAGLRINANLHKPLLCVENVFKVASGDLSLPGLVVPAR